MSSLDPLRLVNGSHRADFDGEYAGKPGVNETLEVVLQLRRKRPLHAHALVASGLALQRNVLESNFGVDEDELAAVLEFLHEHNLWGVNIERNKRLITVHGSVRCFEKAFKTSLELRKRNGKIHRVRTGPLFIPGSLAEIVTGVFGLDNRPQATPHLIRSNIIPKSFFKPNAFDGNQLAKIYNFPPGAGQGQVIALIELGGGVLTPDLVVFFHALKLPMPDVKHVSVNGARNQPGLDPGADGEVTLDVEVAGAVAPRATIVVYHSTNDDAGFLQAILAAIHDDANKPTIISISWGMAESAWTQQSLAAFDDAFQSAAALAISVFAAAGDDGANDNVNDGLAHVDFPSSSPFVTACGGTTLVVSTNSSQETVWNDGNGSATGGGISDVFSRPNYQSLIPMPTNLGTGKAGRGVPDVAAAADPRTGYAVFLHGLWQVFGGTSAVAPLFSGLVARMNQQLSAPAGAMNALLYSGAGQSTFNDITSGNNSCDDVQGYESTFGWDAVTGWGSPNGQAIFKLFGNANGSSGTAPPTSPAA